MNWRYDWIDARRHLLGCAASDWASVNQSIFVEQSVNADEQLDVVNECIEWTGTLTHGADVFDEDLGPAEGVLGGRDGQVPEKARNAVNGDAGAVRPRQRRQHLVALQERRVQLTEYVTVTFHPRRLQQPSRPPPQISTLVSIQYHHDLHHHDQHHRGRCCCFY